MSTNDVDIPGRPTPEHIAGLFARYGIRPEPDCYLNTYANPPCGCAVGVLIVEASGSLADADELLRESGDDARWALIELRGLPRKYVFGLDIGFSMSSVEIRRRGDELSPPGRAGLADGRRVRELVLPTEATP